MPDDVQPPSRSRPPAPGGEDPRRGRIEKARGFAVRTLDQAARRLEQRQTAAPREAREHAHEDAMQPSEREADRADRALELLRAQLESALSEIREESTARLESEIEALGTRVDERLAAAIDQATARTAAATERLVESERRGNEVQADVERAIERVERAMRRVEEAERRVVEVEGRLGETEAEITRAVETAERAASWEARMRAAARTEREAAERITDAEERLLHLVADEEGTEPEPA